MNIFKKEQWTKFKPITVYVYNFEDYLLLGRINLKSGYVNFKSIKVHGRNKYTQAYNLFEKPLDANKQLLSLFNDK